MTPEVPTVSVLIPCYNAEKYIGETLESVLRQTWPKLEIVVVNDGSTDGSADIIRKFARPNLRLVEQPNRGQTAALNTCLTYATGHFVQYLDADDLLDPDKIELQIKRLVERPHCLAAGEWGRFYTSPSEAKFRPDDVWRDLDPVEWLVISRKDGLGMMLPALWLIPMSIIRVIGPWNEELTLNNDAEYFTRAVLAAEAVLFCPGARCRYRSGIAGSLSGMRSSKGWRSQERVLELCESYVVAREGSARVRRTFALSWQRLAHACYPYEPEIASQALTHARSLHSVNIRPDGGRLFRLASSLFGWRLARRLQVMTGRP